MRAFSILAFISGMTVLLLSLAAPQIVKWQAENLLERFDATDSAALLIEKRIDEIRAARVINFILGGAMVVGAILVIRRRAIGARIIVIASTLLLAWAVWRVIAAELIALVPGAWWAFFLVLAMRKNSLSKTWQDSSNKTMEPTR